MPLRTTAGGGQGPAGPAGTTSVAGLTDITTVGTAVATATSRANARKGVGIFTSNTTLPTVADGVQAGDICVVF